MSQIVSGSMHPRIRFLVLAAALCAITSLLTVPAFAETAQTEAHKASAHAESQIDYWSMLFVFVMATFIGMGVIRRVSRLLHTPLMSLTNAISAIAVVGSIVVTGADYPPMIRLLGGIALFASMTNIVSGFLITDRMLRMFKKQ
jgi:NAD(P) transhydrogenase subunit alpha